MCIVVMHRLLLAAVVCVYGQAEIVTTRNDSFDFSLCKIGRQLIQVTPVAPAMLSKPLKSSFDSEEVD